MTPSGDTKRTARRKPDARDLFDDQISSLIRQAGGTPHAELIEEIIITALKLVGDRANRGELKILNAALKELRYAFKLFAPYRHIRKVTVFGSARTREDEPAYQQAVKFARLISQAGYMVITGAGDGIMEGAQEGAGRANSFGVNILLPFEQHPNKFIQDDPKLVTFKYFFTRKLIFVKEASALVLFPGGFGTHDEAYESLTLMQTGKGDIMPVVFLDEPGGTFWRDWKTHVEQQMVKREMILPDDMNFFAVTDQAEEAVKEITNFYRVYHSARHVEDRLVIRLNQPISPDQIERLNSEFQDILREGKIEASQALAPELREKELVHLPRLVFKFNRKSQGRLRQLINAINQAVPSP
jgi:uncharacterized protein (TIGR00730 family)